MRILLTGSAGFTGRFFKSAAEKAGHQVVHLQADLTNKDAVADEVFHLKPDAVVHLAAISFVGYTNETAIYGVNVVGTMNLLAGLAALPIKPSKILLASSANVYGNCNVSPIGETQTPCPVNHYAMSKLAMEFLAHTYSDRLPIIITRPFNYTGPGQEIHFLIPKIVSHFANKTDEIELGNLYVEREYNDVRMVCDAYLALLAYGVPGEVYNVCSGKPYTLKHLIELLISITGRKMDVRVNLDFVRPNEVHRLCGSPDKLLAVTGPLEQYELFDTLKWMLDVATADVHK